MANEWFRSLDWTSDAQADFEIRLRRARPHSRAQYLRIKALALISAGQNEGAEQLLQRVVTEHHEEWVQVAPAYEHLGELRRAAGDLAGAEGAFRAALEASPTLSCTTGEIHLKIGEILLEVDPTRTEEVGRLLEAARSHTKLNTSVFRWNVLSARLALARGDRWTAKAAAAGALAVIDALPQFSRHPTVGLARPPQALIEELEAIARS